MTNQLDLFSHPPPSEVLAASAVAPAAPPPELAVGVHDPWARWPVCVDDVDPRTIKAVMDSIDSAYQAARHQSSVFAWAVELWWCTVNRFSPGAEERYMELVKLLGPEATRALVPGFGALVNHFFMDGGFADVMGRVYQEVRSSWGRKALGQFFTPWPVCVAMSRMTMGDIEERLADGGEVSVCDPAVGSGTMLLAARAVVAMDHGRAASWRVKCFGQDIDHVCVNMARLQLRLADERYMRNFYLASAAEVA